nr:LPTK55=PDGF receptor tyrosine kinase homolog [Hirudo medicinalis=leeches, Annelida, embryonic, Peptide, 55 aa] [Hirudo medicinalis]
NILLGTNKTIKLCDFGLARLIYRGDGHSFRKTNTKLPIKWMALESIRDRVYTSRS